jgi:uncharacterized protein
MHKNQNSVSVKRSRSGLGLFATKQFKKGELIIEYIGEHLTNDEADRRGGKYLFILNDDIVVDGKGRDNIARYVNHSCKPNAEVEIDEKKKRIFIHAKKKIAPGDEIAYDYGKEYWNEYIKPHGCRCHACMPLC